MVHNLRLNELAQVVPLRFALSAEPGVLEMDPVDDYDGRVQVGGGGDPVEARTLDSFRFPRVDLIKLDVEGHEYECLQGARMCLENGETVFVVEILHANEDKDHILTLFSNYGYEHFVIPENVGWIGNKGYNYVFRPSRNFGY